ncbi:ABC transporter substrate-binding protein [Haloimpatiens sp. FM7330]|uniref:ABC transporter substrate-binding protein n=1 Tax=Haloimpatiens sp. FM7330 TaxID=3298610 RepID=UPI003624C7A4
MKFKKYITCILVIIIICSGCSSSKEKIIYKKNGYPDLIGKHLVVYVASREEVGKRLLEIFKEKTGCTYEYMRMPTEEALRRVRLEKKCPKADIFIGGTCDAHINMKKEYLSEKYESNNSVNVYDDYKDEDGYWTGIELEPISIVVNKDRWDKEFSSMGLEVPKTFEDLLNPVYKGEIVMPDPYTSGTAYTFITSLVQNMGEEKAKTYFKKLKYNVGQFTMNGYTPCQKVGTGEYLIGINFFGDQLMMKKSGFNLICNVPKDAGWTIDSISKIKNGPNGTIGNLFIDFCLSKEAGNILKNMSMGISVRKDADKDEKMLKIVHSKIYRNYDFEKAAVNKEKVLNLWESAN